VVASIPTGELPQQIGANECIDCEEYCTIGFAFLGSDGRLFFYDFAHRNLKSIGTSGSAAPTVLPGLDDQPFAGAQLYNGDLFVAADRFENGQPEMVGRRFAVYRLRPGQTRWEQVVEFQPPWLGTRDGHPVIDHALGLAVGTDGVLYLHNAGRGIGLARAGSIFSGNERLETSELVARMGRGVLTVAPDRARPFFLDRLGSRVRSLSASRLVLLGSDQSGRLYSMSIFPDLRVTADRLQPDGRTDASIAVPERISPIGLRSGTYLVTPDGQLLHVHATREALVVYRHRFGE
jgi:hypothetical protein